MWYFFLAWFNNESCDDICTKFIVYITGLVSFSFNDIMQLFQIYGIPLLVLLVSWNGLAIKLNIPKCINFDITTLYLYNWYIHKEISMNSLLNQVKEKQCITI